MKYVAILLMVIGIDKFVITDKLPDVDKAPKTPDVQPVEPVSKGCQCPQKCGIEGCQCQSRGQSAKCPAAFQRPSVSIDEDALKKVMAEKSPPIAQWLCFSSKTCQPCIAADGNLSPQFASAGLEYSDSANAPFRKVDYDTNVDLVKQHGITRLPTYVLLVGGEQAQSIVGNPGFRYLVDARVTGEKSIPKKYAGMFDSLTKVGTIKRSQVNDYLAYYNRGTDWLGKVGKVSFDNQAIQKPANEIFPGLPAWLLADLPANLTVGREDVDGLPKFTFGPQPSIRWGEVSQTLAFVEFKADRIVFDLPAAPNVWLAIEED